MMSFPSREEDPTYFFGYSHHTDIQLTTYILSSPSGFWHRGMRGAVGDQLHPPLIHPLHRVSETSQVGDGGGQSFLQCLSR